MWSSLFPAWANRLSTSPLRIIKELASGSRSPTQAEYESLISAIVQAPFSRETKLAEDWSRQDYPIIGEPYPGRPGVVISPEMALTSLVAHTAKRIVDGGWRAGTTPEQYLADLRQAAGHATARLRVGYDAARGRSYWKMGTATDIQACTASLVMVNAAPGKSILVVYNAERNHLQSGYVVHNAVMPGRFQGWRPVRIVRP